VSESASEILIPLLFLLFFCFPCPFLLHIALHATTIIPPKKYKKKTLVFFSSQEFFLGGDSASPQTTHRPKEDTRILKGSLLFFYQLKFVFYHCFAGGKKNKRVYPTLGSGLIGSQDGIEALAWA